MSSSFALLTKSYSGDFEMCRTLCASVDRHMPDVTHYLVIDKRDRALFAPLETGRRRVLETEDFLPEFASLRAFGRRWWLSPYGPPARGWIYQQFAKIAVVATLPEPAIVIVDSDVVFMRAIDPARLLRDGRTRLWRAPGASQGPKHRPWHRAAARLLGLPPQDYFGADYITNLVTWRPEVVRAMTDRIRRSTRLPWRVAASWRPRFSEYIVYGVFADHVEGAHQATLFPDERDLCHCSWHYDLRTEAGRDVFVESFRDDHAAVLIQSNLNLPDAVRDAVVDRIERRREAQAA